MHEFALAEGVVTTALKAAEEERIKRISRIVVAIGELQQIEKELFFRALTEVIPETHAQLAETDIELRMEPVQFCCRFCQKEFTFAGAESDLNEEEAEVLHFIPELAHTYLRCPACSSPDFEIVKGRGVWIETVEGTD